MEVIKRGTKDQVTCHKCDSVLRYTDSDVQLIRRPVYDHYDEIEPEDNYKAVITCPICNTSIGVNVTRSQKAAIMFENRRSDHDL